MVALELKIFLILLDLNLPDIHGSKALQLLQEDELTKEIPVAVITQMLCHNRLTGFYPWEPRSISKAIRSGTSAENADEYYA